MKVVRSLLDKPLVVAWLPMAVTITLLSGLVYGVVQQSLRGTANDVPTQLAEQAVDGLKRGFDPLAVIPQTKSKLKTLTPFVIVFNDSQQPVASSVELNGKTPALPKGVLDYAKSHSANSLSWETADGVRSAIVIRHFTENSGGFVVAGQNLRQTENHEKLLMLSVSIGWLLTLAASFTTFVFIDRVAKK